MIFPGNAQLTPQRHSLTGLQANDVWMEILLLFLKFILCAKERKYYMEILRESV